MAANPHTTATALHDDLFIVFPRLAAIQDFGAAIPSDGKCTPEACTRFLCVKLALKINAVIDLIQGFIDDAEIIFCEFHEYGIDSLSLLTCHYALTCKVAELSLHMGKVERRSRDGTIPRCQLVFMRKMQ